MPKFIYSFDGGRMPESKEEGEKVMKAWTDWMGSIGDAIVDGGGPAGKSKTVTKSGVSDGGGDNPLMGYTIVTAATIDGAISLLKGCPHFDADGTVEVAEIIEM